MADILIDNDCELVFRDNDLVFADGDAALVQHLRIRFQFFLGEWFLDARIGVPYYQSILIKNPDIPFVVSVFRRVVLTTPGIAALQRFDFDLDGTTRRFSISFIANKTDGTNLTFDEEFILV